VGLHKLLAYKDEYEVARLHLDPVERAKVVAEFGADAKVYFLLHPPLLRALGMKRKLKLGPWFRPAFATLRAMRRLRGTPLDLFGLPEVRRVERRLPGEYRERVTRALAHLGTGGDDVRATVAQIAALPDVVRGYEDIKLRNVERFRAEADRLEAQLTAPAQPAVAA
jgi:indolepyruvate ferredoxin oxidoreductase